MRDIREFVSGVTHLIGAMLAFAGTLWMVHQSWEHPSRLVTVTIYGLSMIIVYGASAALHLHASGDGSAQVGLFLQRCDHAAIYLLIAGTYTPLTYHLLDGQWRWGMLLLIWTMAGIGAFFKLFCFWQGHLSTLYYGVMGWVSVFTLPEFLRDPQWGLLTLIILGGVIYTIGAVIFALNRPNLHRHFGHHELWHVLVIGGSVCHFIAVMIYVVQQ